MQDLAIEETSGGGGRKIDLILGIAAIVIVAGASAWFLLGSDGSADLDDIAEPVAASVEASAPTELSVTATEGESATALAEKSAHGFVRRHACRTGWSERVVLLLARRRGQSG